MESTWKCSACGATSPLFASYCRQCNQPIAPSRLTGRTEYPKITAPPSIICYAARSFPILVLIGPNAYAERLYVMGVGDILPIVGEEGDFYHLLLPGAEKGFAHKSSGMKVDVGLGEVKEPLGYLRKHYGSVKVNVAVPVPVDKWETIYTLRDEDRFPVVEEREHHFIVQLPSGVRGWVHKANVMRTISPNSAPVQGTGDFASALGLAALIGISIVGGALAGDPEEARIRRGVEQALRDRGI